MTQHLEIKWRRVGAEVNRMDITEFEERVLRPQMRIVAAVMDTPNVDPRRYDHGCRVVG